MRDRWWPAVNERLRVNFGSHETATAICHIGLTEETSLSVEFCVLPSHGAP